MVSTAIVIALVLIAALLGYAATRADHFEISRTAVIRTSPAAIFPLVNDLREHATWSPFAQDPTTRYAHGGPPTGPGSFIDFEGAKSGAGRLEIAASVPAERIGMTLDMRKPFKARNEIVFTFAPQDAGTAVTWTMQGRQPFIGKLMSLFINCDKMVGRQFEQGLAQLGTRAEGGPAASLDAALVPSPA